MSVEMEFVQSSNLEQIGYDSDNQELYIVFKKSGLTYVYSDVPESVFEELKNAESLGGYFNQNIKDVYSFRKE